MSEEQRRRRETRIRRAALRTAQRLDGVLEGLFGQEGSILWQSVMAIRQLAMLALEFPLAVLGRCAIDGSELQFEGRPTGLWVCCQNNPPHCWRIR